MTALIATLIATLKPIAAGYVVSRIAKRFPIVGVVLKARKALAPPTPVHESHKQQLNNTVAFSRDDILKMSPEQIQALGITADLTPPAAPNTA